jgi:hypothetical protein
MCSWQLTACRPAAGDRQQVGPVPGAAAGRVLRGVGVWPTASMWAPHEPHACMQWQHHGSQLHAAPWSSSGLLNCLVVSWLPLSSRHQGCDASPLSLSMRPAPSYCCLTAAWLLPLVCSVQGGLGRAQPYTLLLPAHGHDSCGPHREAAQLQHTGACGAAALMAAAVGSTPTPTAHSPCSSVQMPVSGGLFGLHAALKATGVNPSRSLLPAAPWVWVAPGCMYSCRLLHAPLGGMLPAAMLACMSWYVPSAGVRQLCDRS